jgi:hypothetical protein
MLLSVAPQDYPLAYAVFPEPIIIGPGKEFVIEAVTDVRLTIEGGRVVMILPPIVLTSRKRVGYV